MNNPFESEHAFSTAVLPADDAGIAAAAETLARGELVALPTETVYGLAADATNGEAVARIYAAKGRPALNPLIVHVDGPAMAARLADLPPLAHRLIEAFWPGPLTLVLPARADSPAAGLVQAGLPTIAIRCPNPPVAQAVIARLGRPIAAPSANPSGRISPTRAEHVRAGLAGRIPLILDAGPTEAGLESTIVAVEGEALRLLRPGPVPAEALAALAPVLAAADGKIQAPGQMTSHYAPRQPVRLGASAPEPHEFFIGFNGLDGNLNLSPKGNLIEAAARLFEALHMAEASGATGIAVAPIPEDGLGAAINDRLRRAAAPR